ncbi:hypothetical protein [Methanosphaera sp.]
MITQIIAAVYKPTIGLRCATIAKAIHSGIKAKEVVTPDKSSFLIINQLYISLKLLK